MTPQTAVPLNDKVLDERQGLVGPVSVKFVGRWDRVEQALAGLEHDDVRFRWATDSSDETALFIEIPVRGSPGIDALSQIRRSLRESLNELEGDRQVYIHFVDASTPMDPTKADEGDA